MKKNNTNKAVENTKKEEKKMTKTLAMNEYFRCMRHYNEEYWSKKSAVEEMIKEMKKDENIPVESIYNLKDAMMKKIVNPYSDGEGKAYRAWSQTMDKTNETAEVIEMNDFLWESEVAGFVYAMREAGAEKFYYTNHSTAVMENLHGFVAAGCKIGNTVSWEVERIFGYKETVLGIEIIL